MNTQSALLARRALEGALLGQQYEGTGRHGVEWDVGVTGQSEHHPARLKETAIENVLVGLRFGRYS